MLSVCIRIPVARGNNPATKPENRISDRERCLIVEVGEINHL